MADGAKDAKGIYDAAASSDPDRNADVYDVLSLSESCASIRYGDCNEDRYGIVDYDQEATASDGRHDKDEN